MKSVGKIKQKKMKLTENPPYIKALNFSTQKKQKSRMVSIKNSKVNSRRRVAKKNTKDLVKSEIIILNKSENKFSTKRERTPAKSRSRTPGRRVVKTKKSILFESKKKRNKSRGVSVKKKLANSKYLKNKGNRDKLTSRKMRTPSKVKRKLK